MVLAFTIMCSVRRTWTLMEACDVFHEHSMTVLAEPVHCIVKCDHAKKLPTLTHSVETQVDLDDTPEHCSKNINGEPSVLAEPVRRIVKFRFVRRFPTLTRSVETQADLEDVKTPEDCSEIDLLVKQMKAMSDRLNALAWKVDQLSQDVVAGKSLRLVEKHSPREV